MTRRRLVRRMLGTLLVALFAPTGLIALYAIVDPPATPLMLIRAAQGHGWRQTWRPLATIAPALRRAVVAAEDNRFCTHSGFDRLAIEREFDVWMEGERPRGASTITMQTAKNILLWPGRDPVRKLVEAWLTPQIELLWNKWRILEVYLNVVEFGPGIYGAEAAARAFFGKPASRLGDREAALLAAVLPNPLARSAAAPERALARRASMIERRGQRLPPALLSCIGA